MSEPKLISPLLDGFAMGDAITDRGGIRTCPALEQESEDKYIVKIISTPASSQQIDALLLTGAYADRDQALSYYKTVSQDIIREAEVLEKLSRLDGFVPGAGSQLVENEDGSGYDVYLLTPYRLSLERHLLTKPFTHLNALNLGLDLCSALTVCRRCGYMYAALKPENVFYIEDKGYKIGDIGFLALDSLKYATLPDRCRSEYLPPEAEDVFEAINTTYDVYAVGMILYRIFNGGFMPEEKNDLQAPEFADQEIAEIILKACAKKPEDRWEDPAQMGQALVGYMQRNGAHDTPIVPVPVDTEPDEEFPESDKNTSSEVQESTEQISTETADEILNLLPDENDTEAVEDDISNEDVALSEELSVILNQADELIAHEPPAPVTPPEPIDVQLPSKDHESETDASAQSEAAEPDSPAEPPEDTVDTEDAEEEQNETDSETLIVAAGEAEDALTEESDDEDEDDEAEKAKSHWLRNTLITLLSLCLLAGGFLFYKLYYLQNIDSLTLSGDDLSLTVFVKTKADESLLSVICYDTYGNQLPAPVVNGKAVFDALAPDCAYTVKVVISGFHSLTGEVAVNYSTPKQTNIIQFSAVTGPEDGSVVLSFAVDGPDQDSWVIRRTASGGEPEDFNCSGHSYTFTGLTVGTEYTYEILSGTDRQIIGNTKITHTATKVVNAVDPLITACQDGKLTVVWNVAEGESVGNWIVHCFNDKGYDQMISTDQLTASFENIVANDPYTIEITADGMSAGQRVYVPENAVTVSEFAVSASDSTSITLGWKCGNNIPENGWILRYSIDGSPVKEVTGKNPDFIVLKPYIADSKYSFELLTADSGNVIGGLLEYTTKTAQDFSGFSVKRSNMNFKMCLTPNVSNWDKDDVRTSDYTTTFKVGQKASFLAKMNKKYGTSSKIVHTTIVIRNAAGTVINFSTTQSKWSSMWRSNYGEFDLPTLPKAAGKYTVTVYFNDAIAAQQEFTMK